MSSVLGVCAAAGAAAATSISATAAAAVTADAAVAVWRRPTALPRCCRCRLFGGRSGAAMLRRGLASCPGCTLAARWAAVGLSLWCARATAVLGDQTPTSRPVARIFWLTLAAAVSCVPPAVKDRMPD